VLATTCALSACSLGRTPVPGNAYLESLGIRARQASDLAAISELQRWSQQNLVTAQRELGLSLARTEDKYPDAVFWLLEAARQGDAEAQFQIAEAFFMRASVCKSKAHKPTAGIRRRLHRMITKQH
jgi:TPR repeat protein